MDYIENLELAPQEVQDIVNDCADKLESGDNEFYQTNKEMQDQLKEVGWEVDYGLCGTPYDLKPINN